MTIIAYRDGVMASDSAVHDNDRYVGEVRKLSRSPDGWIGAACGRDGVCHKFHVWVETGMKGEFDPKCEPGYFGAFVVDLGGLVRRMDAQGLLTTIKAPFYADGSGHELAIGAMAQGATAKEAVAVAIEWDSGCRGPIQIERL